VKVPQDVHETIVLRDGGRCIRCGTSVLSIPASVHHRKPRGAGGTRDVRSYDLRNLVVLCGTGTTGCHGEVESGRTLAYDTGWLLRSYDDLDAPLITKDGRRVYLKADGDRVQVVDAASVLAAAVLQ
jgi:hypothetical protein